MAGQAAHIVLCALALTTTGTFLGLAISSCALRGQYHLAIPVFSLLLVMLVPLSNHWTVRNYVLAERRDRRPQRLDRPPAARRTLRQRLGLSWSTTRALARHLLQLAALLDAVLLTQAASEMRFRTRSCCYRSRARTEKLVLAFMIVVAAGSLLTKAQMLCVLVTVLRSGLWSRLGCGCGGGGEAAGLSAMRYQSLASPSMAAAAAAASMAPSPSLSPPPSPAVLPALPASSSSPSSSAAASFRSSRAFRSQSQSMQPAPADGGAAAADHAPSLLLLDGLEADADEVRDGGGGEVRRVEADIEHGHDHGHDDDDEGEGEDEDVVDESARLLT
ncbi:MAG: hypothetical protein M1826_001953 [Phylliscum demangeonii]|nr:MAG: hypothetical protein M1826_001953 [Phylliscum demangeonii]